MLKIFRDFKGMMPRRDARLLPEGVAQLARNCKLWSGAIRPVKGLRYIAEPHFGGETKSLHLYRNQGLEYWFSWNSRVNAAKAPVAGDVLNRLYWTDGVKPKKTSAALGLATDGIWPSGFYYLGVKAPGGAPTQATQAAGAAATTHVRGYVAVYETAWGEFSTPSSPVETGTVKTDATIRVTKFVETPDALYNITKWRLYRTQTGASGDTDYFFVASADIATAYIDDSLAASALGETLDYPYYDEPPDDMKGLLSLPNGMMVGFSGAEVCFCVPYLPHAWPVDYRYTLDADVVGLGYFGSTVVAATKSKPAALTGNSPDKISISPMMARQSCQSKESLVSGPFGVSYASPDGIYNAAPDGGSLVTKSVLTRDEWQALEPTVIVGEVHDGRYYGSHINHSIGKRQGFIFDPAEPNDLFSEFDAQTEVLFADEETDTLYMLIDGKIFGWDRDDSLRLTALWRSGVQLFEKPINFGCVQVKGDFARVLTGAVLAAFETVRDEIVAFNAALTTPVTEYFGEWGASFGEMAFGGDGSIAYPADIPTPPVFRLYDGKGNLLAERDIPSEEPVKLPGDTEKAEQYFEIETKIDIQEVRLAEAETELPGE